MTSKRPKVLTILIAMLTLAGPPGAPASPVCYADEIAGDDILEP